MPGGSAPWRGSTCRSSADAASLCRHRRRCAGIRGRWGTEIPVTRDDYFCGYHAARAGIGPDRALRQAGPAGGLARRLPVGQFENELFEPEPGRHRALAGEACFERCPALAERGVKADRQRRHHLHARRPCCSGPAPGLRELLARLRRDGRDRLGARRSGGRWPQWMVHGTRGYLDPRDRPAGASGIGATYAAYAVVREPPRDYMTLRSRHPLSRRTSTGPGLPRQQALSGAHDRTAALGAILRGGRAAGSGRGSTCRDTRPSHLAWRRAARPSRPSQAEALAVHRARRPRRLLGLRQVRARRPRRGGLPRRRRRQPPPPPGSAEPA